MQRVKLIVKAQLFLEYVTINLQHIMDINGNI